MTSPTSGHQEVRAALTDAHWHQLTVESGILPEILAEEGVYSKPAGTAPPDPDPVFRHPNSNKGQTFPYWPPAATDEAGKRVSPNAAIAPVMLTSTVTRSAPPNSREILDQRTRLVFVWASHAVMVSAPSNSMVFVR